MPATSQLDWLSSTTAMIVLFWSRATRDLLKSFGWGIAALHRLHSARKLPSPRRPPHRISRSRVASRYRHVMPWIVDRRHYVPSAAAIACPAPPRTALSFAQVLERNLLWQR